MKILETPSCMYSEKMCLGAMIGNFNCLNSGIDDLLECDFYFKEHREIFLVLMFFHSSDKPTDIQYLAEELIKRERLEAIGGIRYLTDLIDMTTGGIDFEFYCRTIKEKAGYRKLIEYAQNLEKEAVEQKKTLEDVLDQAQSDILKISLHKNDKSSYEITQILSGEKAKSKISYLSEIAQRQENFLKFGDTSHVMTGIPTGFKDLDKKLDGLNDSNLIILAARPAMGKTALAINIAENLSFESDVPVGIFSLEMSAEQIVHRIICSQTQISSEKIKKGNLTGDEYQKIVKKVNHFKSKKLIIDDQPGLRVNDLRARARRMKEAYNIGFIVIDYLQLLSGASNSRGPENRQVEISEISRILKNTARELDIPILCLSQLSRKVEERAGHRPMMSDLRESGSIEQDADQVLFLLRRDYYDEQDHPGIAEVIVGKNRHGDTGDVKFTFLKDIAKFVDYSPFSSDDDESSESQFNNIGF